MPPDLQDADAQESVGAGCTVARYIALSLSLVPPILLWQVASIQQGHEYSTPSLILTVSTLVASPIIALLELFMLVVMRESKLDIVLFGLGAIISAFPIVMFWIGRLTDHG